MRKKLLSILGPLLFLIFIIDKNVYAQGMTIPGVSPSMLSQFSTMSPDQRRELAASYGINLEDLGMIGDGGGANDIGMPGNELESDANQALYERIIDAQENTKKAAKYRKDNIPLFEQDYSSIEDLPVYGKFLFDGEFSSFSPVDNAPVPNDYVLGVGDSLRVLLYGIEDSEFNLVINRQGNINFPELGEISIAGMSFSEASEYLKTRVSRQMIGVEIGISVGRLRSINVFMSGEAKISGMYSVSGLSNVSQLLYVAGGITDIGSLRNIQIRRANEIIATFDLYELLARGNAENDIRLLSGDVVFIPTIKKSVYIDGAIRRPGKYELKDKEVMSDLIDLAGGFSNRAYLKQVYIERYDHDSDVPSIINLDLTDDEQLDYKISDGDIIRIARVTNQLSNSVVLKGAVKRPGRYGWYKGIRFSNILSTINADFQDNFDTDKGLIVRRINANNYDIEELAAILKFEYVPLNKGVIQRRIFDLKKKFAKQQKYQKFFNDAEKRLIENLELYNKQWWKEQYEYDGSEAAKVLQNQFLTKNAKEVRDKTNQLINQEKNIIGRAKLPINRTFATKNAVQGKINGMLITETKRIINFDSHYRQILDPSSVDCEGIDYAQNLETRLYNSSNYIVNLNVNLLMNYHLLLFQSY